MKRQYTFLLFIIFSFIPLPFLSGIFNKSLYEFSAIWDAISFQIVYISAILLFIMTFVQTKKSSKDFFIYKLIWLQEMFIISGLSGTIIGFVLTLNAMEMENLEYDPMATLIASLAISMITIVYGFMGAVTVYIIQKYNEMSIDKKTDNIVEKPKEGFLLSSLIYFLIVGIFTFLSIAIGSEGAGGIKVLASSEGLIYIVTILIIFIFFYKGNSIINLIKNLFWYIPDQEKNIEYNLKYIRNMKKIVSMFIIISLMCAPIVMLVGLCCIPPEMNNIGWNHIPFIGIQNGGVIFLWSLSIIIIFSVIEGREVSKLYFETGKVSAGDRFFSLKYILSSAFLLFFTVSIGIMLTFVAL